MIYIATSQIAQIRPAMKTLHSYFVDLDHKLEVATGGLIEDLEKVDVFMDLLFADPVQVSDYKQKIDELIAARNALKSLPTFVAKSPIVQISEIDKAAPPTNRALQLWVETIYKLWFGLGRTISNTNDGINGRKHLMNFLEFCMCPIHEALEFETLDNMLRKVQRDVAKRGRLTSPDFRLGSSSLLRVSWSNSES